jgi:hypothetical protein
MHVPRVPPSLGLAPLRALRVAATLILLLTLPACRTTSIMSAVGNQARYAPERRGYVVVTLANPDQAILLVDPLRLRKVRCREEFEPWMRSYAKVLPDRVHDQGWESNSYAYLFPFTMVAGASLVAAGVVGGIPFAIASTPYWAARSRVSSRVYDDALNDFAAQRYERAVSRFEEVLMRGDLQAPQSQYLHYYLGLTYEQIGKNELAGIALAHFLETSTATDARAYDVAEARLLSVRGEGLAACRSQDPVTMPWGEDGPAMAVEPR